jgi:hypothetical protein
VSSYLGDGTSGIYIWQAQLETGSVATSPIYTEGSTVARTADDISLASASSLIGQTEGTMYVEVDWRASAGNFQVLLGVSSGNAVNDIIIYKDQTSSELRMLIVSNSVLETDQGQSTAGYSGINKFAFAYGQDNCALYRNGSSISTDTSVDLSALGTLTDIKIGQSVINTLQANMWIRSVALFPTRLSNSQLETLTTL